MPRESLLGSAYNYQFNQCQIGKKNWASKVKNTLQRYGFGWLWENQSVYDNNSFIKLFKERVQDCETQLWHDEIHSLPKLRTYCRFKESRVEEPYLSLSIPRRLKVALARFRTSNHNLEIETGRRGNIPPENRLCKYCAMNDIAIIEDEYHVIFHCEKYKYLRDMYLDKTVVENPNLYNFICLLKSNQYHVLLGLANFVHSVFKLRKVMP